MSFEALGAKEVGGGGAGGNDGWESLSGVEYTSGLQREDGGGISESENAERYKFTEIEKDVYRVEGVLTLEDIEKMNSMKNKTTIVINNTRGLTSELLREIESDTVFFSVKGGLDYEKKNKYGAEKYKNRTMLSPKGLERVVGYFERIEREMNPEWTDLQKAMYAYNCLAVDMDYVHEEEGGQCDAGFDKEMGRGTIERSLNGVLYGRLVCAGFALAFQEMMDRMSIESYYQNEKDTHAYNVIGCDGKYYGVDVTWDSCKKSAQKGQCGFLDFGMDEDFYSRYGHRNYREEVDWYDNDSVARVYDGEEERFELSTFSEDELRQNLREILLNIDHRQDGRPYRNFLEQSKEIRAKYLPIDTVRMNVEKEASQDYERFVIAAHCLREMGALEMNSGPISFVRSRIGYILDVLCGGGYGHESSFGKSEIEQCRRIKAAERRNESVDEGEKRRLVEVLNAQLIEQLDGYLDEILKSMDDIIDAYEYVPDEMDENRYTRQVNRYTKMNAILEAKGYLMEKGYDETLISDVCNRIKEKIELVHGTHTISEEANKERELDFLSGTFANPFDIREAMERIGGAKLSDDEFLEKVTDIDYVLGSVYPELDLSEYGVTREEFADLVGSNVLRYRKDDSAFDSKSVV